MQYYGDHKANFIKSQEKFLQIFKGAVKTIVVVRDPFNTILRKCKLALEQSKVSIKERTMKTSYGTLNNRTLSKIPGDLNGRIFDYMNWMMSVDEIKKNNLFNVKLIHLEAMFKDPEPTVREWCLWLKIECFPEYISLIKNTTKSSGNSDKLSYYWPKKAIETVNNFIQKHSHLYLNSGKDANMDPDYFKDAIPY